MIKIMIKNRPSAKIYTNKVENRITFEIKNRYSLELLTKETMKLLGSTENKITKDKILEKLLLVKVMTIQQVAC